VWGVGKRNGTKEKKSSRKADEKGKKKRAKGTLKWTALTPESATASLLKTEQKNL